MTYDTVLNAWKIEYSSTHGVGDGVYYSYDYHHNGYDDCATVNGNGGINLNRNAQTYFDINDPNTDGVDNSAVYLSLIHI